MSIWTSSVIATIPSSPTGRRMQTTDKSRRFALQAMQDMSLMRQQYAALSSGKKLGREGLAQLASGKLRLQEAVARTGSKAAMTMLDDGKLNPLKSMQDAYWRQYFASMATAETELKADVLKSYSDNKEIRQFEKFGSSQIGDELERKAIVQSLADGLDNSLPASERLPFASGQAAQEASLFLKTESQEQQELQEFVAGDSCLNIQTQTEILGCLQESYERTSIENPETPFYAENAIIQKMKGLSDGELLSSLDAYKKDLDESGTGRDNSAAFDFYADWYKKESGKKKPNLHEIEVHARKLREDLQKSLDERYIAWRLEQLDTARKAYLADLYKYLAWVRKSVSNIKKLGSMISVFMSPDKLAEMFVASSRKLWADRKWESDGFANSYDFPGHGWGLSEGRFGDYGFALLKEFADLLGNDEALNDLADIIGRQEEEQERYEKELRDKIEIKTEYHPHPAYRGQISGLKLSGEISSALPTELALSQTPATTLYFAQKFAEKKLLSYAYINRVKSVRTEHTQEEVDVASTETEQKGPVIICVDTSGSMSGAPERIAKTITFALAKKCLEGERGCYLISFSTGIEVQDLSVFDAAGGLTALIRFLRNSFNGGTDASPALEHSLELMQKKEWKNADVLVVSDMIMRTLADDVVRKMKNQQEKKTKFYSLVIGSSGNSDVMSCFDEVWSYDTNARDAMRHLVRQINSIGERGEKDI